MKKIAVLMTIVIVPLPVFAEAEKHSSDAVVQAISESAQQSYPAKVVDRAAPRFPAKELRQGREAWVHVTFCIDESGTVRNVSVLDSIGNESFDRAAIRATETWKYEPAMRDGNPSWQSKNNAYISFAIEGMDRGAKRKFVKQFRAIGKLIDEVELEEADTLFRQVYDESDLSLYELGKLWQQRVRYEGKSGDMYRLQMALHRATASDGQWIDKKSYKQLLELRARTEISLGLYSEAKHSFAELVDAVGNSSDRVIALQGAMDKLQEMIDGEDALLINAEVRSKGHCAFCDDSWYFSPARREFAIRNVSGTLSSIDMRCQHKRFEAPVSDAVEWRIPNSWGKCQVQIYGEPGTTFEVVMFPDDQA